MKGLAKNVGIAPEILTRTLKGNPQYSTLKKVAEYLNVSVRDLFKGEEIKTESKEMHGCIFFNGEVFTFNSRLELENFLKQN